MSVAVVVASGDNGSVDDFAAGVAGSAGVAGVAGVAAVPADGTAGVAGVAGVAGLAGVAAGAEAGWATVADEIMPKAIPLASKMDVFIRSSFS